MASSGMHSLLSVLMQMMTMVTIPKFTTMPPFKGCWHSSSQLGLPPLHSSTDKHVALLQRCPVIQEDKASHLSCILPTLQKRLSFFFTSEKEYALENKSKMVAK